MALLRCRPLAQYLPSGILVGARSRVRDHLHLRLQSSINVNKELQQEQTPSAAKIHPWVPIYHLPFIGWVAALNRLKLYQTALTAVAIPTAYGLEQMNQLSSATSAIVSAIGFSGILTLIITSVVTKNMVGFVYVNDAKDEVKFAYVNFWGNRREYIASADELLHAVEISTKLYFNTFDSIALGCDGKYKLKLSHRFGNVLKSEEFLNLFGS